MEDRKIKELRGRWHHIKQRCYNPNCPSFKRYGGRGITMSDEWLESFENFLKDMGFPPSKTHSIDRIDNDLGYSKENCRWATPKEQANNKTQRGCSGAEVKQVISFRLEPSAKSAIVEKYGSVQKWVDGEIIKSLDS